MKERILSLAMVVMFSFVACAQHDKDHIKPNAKDSTITANEYMHRSSTENLIKNFESPRRDAYQKPEEVLAYLGDLQDMKIMDLGAGSGYFSVRMAEKGAKVIAADVNDEFQKALHKRITDYNLENIELRKIPYDSPDLKSNEVDKVLVVNTYHHIENRSEYFKKVKTGTKPEGELVIIDYYKSDIPVGPPLGHKISMDVVINELKAAGYTEFTINVNMLPYQYIIRAR